MYEILCYGDSNTWGQNPRTQERYPRDVRWPGVLQDTLGSDFHVIEEGLSGRTTVWDDPVEGHKNGKTYLIPCLESHRPLDLVIIMLGTNDLKMRYSVPAFDIGLSVGVLVDIVNKSSAGRNGAHPAVLLLAPPPLGKLTEFAELLEGGQQKSEKIPRYYRDIASQFGCAFFDTSMVIKSSDIDGVHLEEKDHHALGKALAKIISQSSIATDATEKENRDVL